MKKKLCFLLTLLLVLALLPSAAFAAEGSLLSIDNAYTDLNMNNKSYSQGYLPVVTSGTARVIIPLIAVSGTIKGNLNITTNLGDPASSPFVFGNYDQTKLGTDVVYGSETKTFYLVDLTLPMVTGRVNGRYPIVVTAQYEKTADNLTYSQSFTVYVTVADGIDPNATPAPTPTPTPEPTEAPLPQPKIMVQNHTITPGDVTAGGTFALSVTLKNTSESQSVQNIKVTAKGDTTDLIPIEDTGSAYIKKIGSGKTADFLVKMQVRQDAKPGPQKVLLAIEYENSKAAAFTTSEEIIVQVKQPIRLEYDKPTIPESVNSGDTISISMKLMNMGKSTLYNVRCAMEAPGLIPEGSVFIGNMESGTSKTGDIYVFVGTIDMPGTEPGENMDGADAGEGMAVPDVAREPAADAGLNIKAESRANIAVSEEVLSSEEMVIPAEEEAPGDAAAPGDAVQAGQYGPTEGKIIITYEDEYGQEYSQEVSFQTVINPPVIQPVSGDEEVPEEPETVSQWWISVIIAGGIAAGLIIFLRIRKKRRMLLEEENEDE